MPKFNTKVITNGVVDDPIALDATYKGLDAPDRRKIDDQILGTQTVALATKAASASGQAYTPTLDGSGGVVPGNLVGSAASGSLAKKLTGRGYAIGPATANASPGATVPLQTYGLIPQAITGLAPNNPGPVIRDPVTSNYMRVAEPRPDDDYVGEADAAGNLIPRPARIVKPSIRISAGDSGFKSGGTASANVTALRTAVARAVAIGALCGMPAAAVGVEIDGGEYQINDTVVIAANDADNAYQCGVVVCGAIRSRTSGAANNTQITWTAAASGSGAAASIAAGTGVVTGITGASSAWVGQYFYVSAGANRGHYPIVAYTSSTQITIGTSGGTLQNQAGASWKVVKPMFAILSRDCAVEGLNFYASAGASALCAVQMTQSIGTTPRPCTRNSCDRVRVSNEGTGGTIVWGFTIGDAIGAGAEPNNCDFMRFVDCVVDRTALGGWCVANATGQSKRHSLWDCLALFTVYGIRLRSGSFACYSMSFNSLTYGIAATISTDSLEVYSPDVEHVARFLVAEGAQNSGFPVTLCGGRYDVSDLVAVQTAALGSSDGIFIQWNWSPLIMIGLIFGGYVPTFGIEVAAASTQPSLCEMRGGTFPGTVLPWVRDVSGFHPQIYKTSNVSGTDNTGARTEIQSGTTEYNFTTANLPTESIPTIAGVSGVSTLGERMANFEGSVAIGGATASAQIVFPIAELADGYRVRIGVESLYGTPAAGSIQTYVSPLYGQTNKKTGFTLSLGAAPGANACNEYHWQIVGGRWTPLKIVGLRHLWLAHQKVTFSAGVIISSWNDVLANTALTPPAAAPTIATWRNGMPAVTFVSASSQYLQSASIGPYSQPRSLALVCQVSDLAAERVAIDGLATANYIDQTAAPVIHLGASNSVSYNGDLSSPSCVIGVYNRTSSGRYLNGVYETNGSDIGTNTLDGFTVGGYHVGPAFFWNGSIALIADIDGVISAADAASFTSWARDLYAF